VAECWVAANNDNNKADVHVSDIKFCVMRFRLDLTTCSNSSSSIVPEELSWGVITAGNMVCTKVKDDSSLCAQAIIDLHVLNVNLSECCSELEQVRWNNCAITPIAHDVLWE
jgi:hypothetical protein